MQLLLDSFWRAVAYCLHPRVIALSIVPVLVMVASSFALGYFFWSPAVAGVTLWLDQWDLFHSVLGLFEVRTSLYQPGLDIFNGCKPPVTAAQ